MWLTENEVHEGDARELLKRIEPGSVALSVWSPPYHVGKDYESHLDYEAWKSMLREVIAHHFDLLKPGGFLVVNIADILCFKDESMPRIQAANTSLHRSPITREMVLAAKAEHPDYNRDKLAKLLGCSEQTIDRRLNGNNIRGGKYSTQTRVHLVGHMIEQAGLDAGLYMYDRRIWVKDAAWQNSRWASSSYRAVDEFEYLYFLWKPGITTVERSKLSPQEWTEWGSRAVWNIPSVRANDDHEAKFPVALIDRVIRLLTSPGELVLDCFMGSGTTAIAAIRSGRKFIGTELHSKYVELARDRIDQETRQLTFENETS